MSAGISGFYAGGLPAVLDQNLFIRYGIPETLPFDTSAPVVTALDRLGNFEVDQRRRDVEELFDDIEDAPVCR